MISSAALKSWKRKRINNPDREVQLCLEETEPVRHGVVVDLVEAGVVWAGWGVTVPELDPVESVSARTVAPECPIS